MTNSCMLRRSLTDNLFKNKIHLKHILYKLNTVIEFVEVSSFRFRFGNKSDQKSLRQKKARVYEDTEGNSGHQKSRG